MKNPHAHYKDFLRTQGFNSPGLLKNRHPKLYRRASTGAFGKAKPVKFKSIR